MNVGSTEASLHTRTARWVAERVLGVKFDEAGCCDGAGLVVGADVQKEEGSKEAGVTESIKRISLGDDGWKQS